MKIKLLLSVSILFFVGLFAIPCYSQNQMISISNLKYTSGNAIPNGTPIRIAAGGTVYVTFDLGINNPQLALIKGGTLAVYSKFSNTSTLVHASFNFGQNAITGSINRQCTIELRASHFPSGSGSIYAQFSPIDNSPISGTSIPVKVVPLITSNYIIGDKTIYEGDPVGSIDGSVPSGGDGLYTYSWQQKVGSAGSWITIPGATGITFKPTNVSVSSISYRRIVTSLFGTLTHTSNEVTVTISANVPLLNNVITFNGATVLGSLPTGGLGLYQYSWIIIGGEVDIPLPDTGQNLEFPSWTYSPANENLKATTGLYVIRIVKSGSKTLSSNILKIPPTPSVQNNTISLNRNTVSGSLPTGGNGVYQYSWALWGGPEEYVFPDTGQNLELPSSLYNDLNERLKVNPGLRIVRYVKSGSQTLSSNVLNLPPTPPVQNNTISLNGNTVEGSLPIGGIGIYEYYWQLDGGEISILIPDKGQNLELPSWVHNEMYEAINSRYGLYITRFVGSGIRGVSNTLKIPLLKSNQIFSTTSKIVDDLTVYPNPTSESLNFATNFAEDKNIEIVLYSEKLGNEKSVYKGKVTPNQVVNWNIPPGYQKGLYFYKILSDNKEVKTGKVIFQ